MERGVTENITLNVYGLRLKNKMEMSGKEKIE
jgi:hypothetical protein